QPSRGYTTYYGVQVTPIADAEDIVRLDPAHVVEIERDGARGRITMDDGEVYEGAIGEHAGTLLVAENAVWIDRTHVGYDTRRPPTEVGDIPAGVVLLLTGIGLATAAVIWIAHDWDTSGFLGGLDEFGRLYAGIPLIVGGLTISGFGIGIMADTRRKMD